MKIFDNWTAPLAAAVLAALLSVAGFTAPPASADPGPRKGAVAAKTPSPKSTSTPRFRRSYVVFKDKLVPLWHKGENHELSWEISKAWKVVIAAPGLKPGNTTRSDSRYKVVSSSTGHVAFQLKEGLNPENIERFTPANSYDVEGYDDVVESVTLYDNDKDPGLTLTKTHKVAKETPPTSAPSATPAPTPQPTSVPTTRPTEVPSPAPSTKPSPVATSLPGLPVLPDPSTLKVEARADQELWPTKEGGTLTSYTGKLVLNGPLHQIDSRQGLFLTGQVLTGTVPAKNGLSILYLSDKGILGIQPSVGGGWQYSVPGQTHRATLRFGASLRTEIYADPPPTYPAWFNANIGYEGSIKTDDAEGKRLIKGVRPFADLAFNDLPSGRAGARLLWIATDDFELGFGAYAQGRGHVDGRVVIQGVGEIIGGRVGPVNYSLGVGFNPISNAAPTFNGSVAFEPFAKRIGE